MSEPVVIGIREVYDAVQELKGRVDAFVSSTNVDIALLKQDVDTLKRQGEGERSRRWALWLAVISAFVAIVMGTLAIIIK